MKVDVQLGSEDRYYTQLCNLTEGDYAVVSEGALTGCVIRKFSKGYTFCLDTLDYWVVGESIRVRKLLPGEVITITVKE